MESIKQKDKKSFPALKNAFGYSNIMESPHVVKVVVSSGTGSGSKNDKNRNTLIADRLAKITGQKVALRGAKKSIASFKLRQGDPVGFSVTLRGQRMYDFLDRLINVAIPRTRDFRGYDVRSIDEMGNITLGIPEHSIFPETADEELKDVFGLSVTIVSTAKNKEEAEAFFRSIGIPLKKTKDVTK